MGGVFPLKSSSLNIWNICNKKDQKNVLTDHKVTCYILLCCNLIINGRHFFLIENGCFSSIIQKILYTYIVGLACTLLCKWRLIWPDAMKLAKYQNVVTGPLYVYEWMITCPWLYINVRCKYFDKRLILIVRVNAFVKYDSWGTCSFQNILWALQSMSWYVQKISIDSFETICLRIYHVCLPRENI